jgi:hypothetical protein
MACTGYEHFGIVDASREEAEEIWMRLNAEPQDVCLDPIKTDASGYLNFKFRHLLPLAIEVQSFP